MSFKKLNLFPKLLETLEKLGYITPTPIQSESIPKILEGLDLRASAPTGTGKTAAFILPVLNRLTTPSPKKGRGPRILILVPTRELAIQVSSQAEKYSKDCFRMKTVCIYGGTPYPPQNRQLSRPYEILVATPGRLIDHINRKRIDFSRIEMFILDEADRMLDMGFIDPVKQIAAFVPESRQTLLFSATFKSNVLNLSKSLLNKPVEVIVSHDKKEYENIEQRLHYVDDTNHKYTLLSHFLKDPELKQVIIFTSTKKQADHLAEKLKKLEHPAAALHGDMNQRQRIQTLTKLRRGKLRILIATDVASRGIDISTISHVVNFDLPMNAEDYVHRIGRTGRAGAKGLALSFVSFKDMHLIREIQQFTGKTIPTYTVEGMEPKLTPPTKLKTYRQRRPRNNFKRRFNRKKPGLKQYSK